MTSGVSAANNRQYIYNTSELRGALGAKGLESARIDSVLQEVDSGSIDTLKSLGLEGHVAASGAADLPATEINAPALSSATAKATGTNILDIMILMNQTNMELRQANKEVRIAEAQSSMQASMNSADKIRDAGRTSLIVGIISGAVSIGTSAFSMASSAKQIGNMKSPATQMKNANTELNQVKADANLGTAQSKLSTAKQELTQVNQKLGNTQKALDSGTLQPATRSKLQSQKSVLENAKTDISKNVSSLEKEIGSLSKTANSANNSQIKSLNKEISATQKEIKGLEGKTDATSVQQRTAAEKNLTQLESRLTSCQSMKSVYSNPTSDANLQNGGALAAANNAKIAPGGATSSRVAQAETAFTAANAGAAANMPKAQGVGMMGHGVSQMIQSVGGMFTANAQAEQAEQSSLAQMHSAMAGESSDYMKTFAESASSALETLKECLQSQNQAARAIYQNM